MSNMVDFGIDLGTSNSAIAKYEDGVVRIFKNRDQMEVTPSVVRIEKTGRIIVGRRAYQMLLSNPENVAAEFKRWMGLSDKKTFSSVSRAYSAEDLSAEVLKALREDAEQQTGTKINAAVITVPDAFGQLQCEATVRAASLSGIIQSPLLQEPLAASIAYGLKPDTKDKRWLVYDLGGGTFDIAVVSTKDGWITVLEHKGDNMLGGKDFDRLIVRDIIWPHLQKNYKMPEEADTSGEYSKLHQILRLKAEEIKIDLSNAVTTTLSLFDIGKDKEGKSIETELTIKRAEINRLVEPMIARTIELSKTALEGAKVNKAELVCIVLVGGPTRMPIVREMLSAEIDTPLDLSIDPMTVVAKGAAIYASTIPLEQTKASAKKEGTVRVDLSYETTWAELTCLVGGRIDSGPDNVKNLEVKIDAESGHWTSGWLKPREMYFEVEAQLLENKTTKFWLYLRDTLGNQLQPDPDSFSIRHGLTFAEPPLPHSLGVEVIGKDGKKELDIIFPRSSPLPIKKKIIYKAVKTLQPKEAGEHLGVKIWEGEHVSDPEANAFVGALRIGAEEILRPIPIGSDIELTVAISASRIMEVKAFVPIIHQHFEQRVFIPEENQETIMVRLGELKTELVDLGSRVADIVSITKEIIDPSLGGVLEIVSDKLQKLKEEHERIMAENKKDPDDARRLIQEGREIRGELSEIERRFTAQNKMQVLLARVSNDRTDVGEIVTKFGSVVDQKEFELLCRELDRTAEKEDIKNLEASLDNLDGLKWKVLKQQDWWWKQMFEGLAQNLGNMVNQLEARRLIVEGEEAQLRGESHALQEIVSKLFQLLPKSEVEKGMELALRVGLKKSTE